MTRPVRLLAALGAAALLLTGCADGSAPGSAATVGSTRISVDELQQVVDRGLADPQARQQPGNDRPSFQLKVLNRLVRAALLEDAAKANGVTVTRGDVDAFIAQSADQVGGREQLDKQAAANGIAPQDLPALARALVLQQKLGDKLTEGADVPQAQLQQLYDSRQSQYDQVRSRHILVQSEATARDLLAKVQADPSQFAALAAQSSIDTSNKDKGGELGFQGKGTFVPEFEKVVFSAPVGSFNVVQTQFGWHVVQVEERKTVSLAEATPDLRREVLQQQTQDAVQKTVKQTADKDEVTVNPRFGRWDGEQLQVVPVPADDGMSSPAPSQGGAGTAPGAGTGQPGGVEQQPGTGQQPGAEQPGAEQPGTQPGAGQPTASATP